MSAHFISLFFLFTLTAALYITRLTPAILLFYCFVIHGIVFSKDGVFDGSIDHPLRRSDLMNVNGIQNRVERRYRVILSSTDMFLFFSWSNRVIISSVARDIVHNDHSHTRDAIGRVLMSVGGVA